jgi:adenylate cyclase
MTETKNQAGEKSGNRTREILADWLVEMRRRRQRTTILFDGFCRCLLEMGIPVDRVTLHLPQLHPQIRARTYLWERESGGAVETGWQHGTETSSIYLDSPIRMVFETQEMIHCPIDPKADDQAFPVLTDLAARGYRDYAVFPLVFSEGLPNSLTIATFGEDGFSKADFTVMESAIPYLAVLLELNHVHRMARDLLATYLGRQTGGEVLNGTIKRGDVRRIEAVLWACDLRNFTVLSQSMDLDDVIPLLNDYFDAVGAAIERHGGEILKFIGDALLAIFPVDDKPGSREKACEAALAAAADALDGVASTGRDIRCGIALHIGEAMYGNIGVSDRLDFTVIGPDVNLVSRLETIASETAPPIALSENFAAYCSRPLRSLGTRRFKGLEEPREVFTLHQGN